MKTIKNNVTNEIIINKSKFITLLFKIDSEEAALRELNIMKKEYKDATHYCYAYIIDNIRRFNDDGEPSGTAGIPIMDVLNKNDLNYVLGVVVRYFGGIKLGAGGLVRAYSRSVREALKLALVTNLIPAKRISITFDYDQKKDVEYLLKSSIILKKDYDNKITYLVDIADENIINNLKLIDKIDFMELSNSYIEL